jgi:hypothetical protein
MRGLDFSSWQGILSTLTGLALVTMIGIGVRLLVMYTIQQKRERANRQINERLKVLIAAYKTLGGSFTGDLSVDPTHLRDIVRQADGESAGSGSDRSRRVRDAVEAALSDILLLGTEEQVRLAGKAALELASGVPVHTHDLVVSLRSFIREALDLDPIPADVEIPSQGPTRPASAGGRGKAGGDGERQGGGNRGGGGAGTGMGAGMGLGVGLGASVTDDEIAGDAGSGPQSRQ